MRFFGFTIWLLLAPLAVSAEEFVVMSYNILRPEWSKPGDPAWEKRVEGVVQIIEAHRPDIVGLQEENEAMVADLIERLREYAYLYPVPGKGAGVLFRYREWTPVTVRRETGTDDRTVTEVLMKGPDGRRVYFYNVHFSPFEEKLRLAAAERVKRLMDSRAEATVPAVLTGDLNCTPGSVPFLYLTSAADGPKLADVFTALGIESTRTANAYKDHGQGGGIRLDHVMFAGGLQPVGAAVVRDQHNGIFPSGHLPVRATFALPPATVR